MKHSLVLITLFSTLSLWSAPQPMMVASSEPVQSSVQVESVPTQMETVTVPATSTINVNYPVYSSQNANNNATNDDEVLVDTVTTPQENLLQKNKSLLISVVGQGVAPVNTSSPAQAYALAKRAAVADAYRLIAEKVKGVRVDGQDLIKNMMVKRSTVRTSVQAMVRNANIVETTFKEGLCEVEMEIVVSHRQFQ